jgi:hypothetical protein
VDFLRIKIYLEKLLKSKKPGTARQLPSQEKQGNCQVKKSKALAKYRFLGC